MNYFHVNNCEFGSDSGIGQTECAPVRRKVDGTFFWGMLPRVELNRERMSLNRIVTLDRTDKAHLMFDILRTRVLKILRQNNWTSVAVTSPTPGCGKTVVSLNLAFSLSHLNDCRTVVADFDLRRPQIADTVGLNGTYSIEEFLKGEATVEKTFLLCGDNIAIAPNSSSVSYAAELLQSPETTPRLAELKNILKPNVLIYDLPPMLANDDVLAFLPNVDCAILVAAAESTTINEIDICESMLSKHTNVLGVVLNKCQFEPERYGY